MLQTRLPFVAFERGYFLDIQCFFPTKQLIGHKILSGPCNLRCYYCHRKEFLEQNYPLIPIETILKKLQKENFYNTIVLTGGEITLYHEAAISIMGHLREKHITTLFSTNGFYPDKVREIVPFSDVMKIDVKGTKSQYKKIAGKEIYDSVLKSIAIGCKKTNIEIKFILHNFTQQQHINEILKDIAQITNMPTNLVIEFQPIRDFLEVGVAEPNIDRIKKICANAKPLPHISLLKHYGEKERIYKLKNGMWEVFLEKEIPLRFNWKKNDV